MYRLTLKEIRDKIKNKEVKIIDVVNDIYKRIEEMEPQIGAFITLTKEYAVKRAEELQIRLDNGEDIGELGGVPIAIKDNICTKGIKTTCGSKILENFIPPYNATVIDRLESAGAIIIGKTNQDEFAMGSSTATSYFKETKNPWDYSRVPGGSSGGSAAVVASDMAYASLGSDTGGSIRQPASYCSVFGMKPTYGAVSRYGLIAFASSLDQIGPFTKTAEDMAIMLNTICAHDEKDTTSINIDYPCYTDNIDENISNMTIGVPNGFISQGINLEVKQAFESSLDILKNLGAKIIDINLDYAKYALATYYIIATAEASSNLARFDGIKYGHRAKDFDSLDDLYKQTRTEGFGEEVKKRIMLGTYVLSSGYYDAYYKRALTVRTKIIEDFKRAFEKVDVICLPTAPNTAFKFGEKSNNPVEMYLEDIYTVPVNIAGLPGISVPAGFDSKGMPIGLQFISPTFEEQRLINISVAFDKVTGYSKNKPNINTESEANR